MRSLKLCSSTALLVAGLTSGCATTSEPYGCSGLPEGVKCHSTRALYEADYGMDGTSGPLAGAAENAAPFLVRSDLIGPAAPAINETVPLRTAPKSMRIWISPYQDQGGDLLMPGRVFTEVETERWIYTNQTVDATDLRIVPSTRPQPQKPLTAVDEDIPQK